jgi:hypothetical protein
LVQEPDAVEATESKEEMISMDASELLRRNRDLEIQLREADDRAMCVQEELNAMMFLNDVQEQQLLELDQTMTSERLNMHESLSSRTRKHKAEVRKLTAEHTNYENQANQMMAQMTEQMEMLQKVAMSRIETLVRLIPNPTSCSLDRLHPRTHPSSHPHPPRTTSHLLTATLYQTNTCRRTS